MSTSQDRQLPDPFPRAELVRKPRFWRLRAFKRRVARVPRLLRVLSPSKSIALDLLLGLIVAGVAVSADLGLHGVKAAQHAFWQRQYDAVAETCGRHDLVPVCRNDFTVSAPPASVLPQDPARFDVWTCTCVAPPRE